MARPRLISDESKLIDENSVLKHINSIIMDIIQISNVHGYIDKNEQVWLNAEDVARGFGFTQERNGIEYVRWERVNDYLLEFGFSPRVGKDSYIPENMVYRLGFKANNEVAAAFQAKLADEILPSIRKHGENQLLKSDVIFDNNTAMTSLDVAEVTGKRHANVMRDIYNLLEQGVHKLNFELMFRISKLGNGAERKDPYYNLTPKGVLILASGYDALLREKIINRLEEWETGHRISPQQVLPSYQISDPIKRAQQWIEEEKTRQLLQNENAEKARLIEEQKPKVVFADAITSSSNSCLIGELAKLIKQAMERKGMHIEIGQNRFFKWLRDNGYLGKSYSRKNIANQEYIEQGLFELKKTVHDENGVLVSKTTSKVTGKGQLYFINGFLSGKFKLEK